MSQRKDAYRIKLFQDEAARCIHRLYEEKRIPNEAMCDVSVRDAESGLVAMSIRPGFIGVTDPSQYHGTDMAVVDMEGNLVYDITPPTENMEMHLAIYRTRPETNAIIHTFPVYCGLFAQRKEPIPLVFVEQGYIMQDFDFGSSRGYSTDVVTMKPEKSQAYYDEIVEKFHGTQFVMLHDNGCIATGDNVDNAINYLSWMEEVAQKITYASFIGKIHYIG